MSIIVYGNKIILRFVGFIIPILVIPFLAVAESHLVWDASTGLVTGYRVYYSPTQGGPYRDFIEVPTTLCSLSRFPLQEGFTYYFIVRAYNDAGESGNSNEVPWTVPESKPVVGYTLPSVSGTSGFFPKIEHMGWTGIAFANIATTTATVTLTARNDVGTALAVTVITLGAHEQCVGFAESFFQKDISSATFISYTASEAVVGLQVNSSSDQTLDALPVLTPSHDTLYFPHVATVDGWETEICIINTDPTEGLTGVLTPLSKSGERVTEPLEIVLNPYGRRQFLISQEFSSDENIAYLIFETSMGSAAGYAKYYDLGRYRVAVPAVVKVNQGDVLVPHIASDAYWWTGICLVNTTPSPRVLSVEFSTGQSYPLTLEPFEHRDFLIREAFGGQLQPNIRWAIIRNGDGMIGMNLFGNENVLMGGILNNEAATDFYYPHLASGLTWWTDVIAFNPNTASCMLTLTAYGSDGTYLSTQRVSIGPGEKYVGRVSDPGLPFDNIWLHLEAELPVVTLEVFGLHP